VITLLLLRGEQTPGELRSRSDRLHAFETLEEVESALATLADGPEPLVAELPRAPGQKETRWAHLVAGPVESAAASPPSTPAERHDPLASRVAALEERIGALSSEVAELKRKLGEG
jgi:uncharacterized protein YceH (UPF0502 family)